MKSGRSATPRPRTLQSAKAAPYGAGNVWTWTALDSDSKMILSWMVGDRDADTANSFMDDLAQRLANPVQLTTDGHHAYLDAVAGAFGNNIDYAMLVKLYGESADAVGPERKYSPSDCIGARKEPITGNPDPAHISTSHVERQNLTMRMSMQRFTRLTNAFTQEDRQPHLRAVALLRVLQLRADAQGAQASPGDGRWRCGSALVDGRYRGADRCAGAQAGRRGPYKKRDAA